MRNLPEFIWSAGVLEGNPFTFNEVKTLLDGITVGSHKIEDQEQILNLNASARYLIRLVRSGQFELSKQHFYNSKDATLMMDFLVHCHPDVELIKKLNAHEHDIER